MVNAVGFIWLTTSALTLGYETLWIYRVVFVGLIMVGAIIPLSNVLRLSLIFASSPSPSPTFLEASLLAPKVKALLVDYWRTLQER